MSIIFKGTESSSKQTLWSLGTQITEGVDELYYQNGKIYYKNSEIKEAHSGLGLSLTLA